MQERHDRQGSFCNQQRRVAAQLLAHSPQQLLRDLMAEEQPRVSRLLEEVPHPGLVRRIKAVLPHHEPATRRQHGQATRSRTPLSVSRGEHPIACMRRSCVPVAC
eukprot:2751702-Prymnesium_polylepis.1